MNNCFLVRNKQSVPKNLRVESWILSFLFAFHLFSLSVFADTLELKDGTIYSGKKVSDLGARIGFMTDESKFLLINKADVKVTSDEKGIEDARTNTSDTHLKVEMDTNASETSMTDSTEEDENDLENVRYKRALSYLGQYPAKDFTARDLKGNEFSLSDFRGKVVVLHFWATWCRGCVHELPKIKDVYKKYKDKDFMLISVSLDRRRGDIVRFVEKAGMEWPQIQDSKVAGGELSDSYGVKGIPANFIIDQEGLIRFKNKGGKDFERSIEILLSGRPDETPVTTSHEE